MMLNLFEKSGVGNFCFYMVLLSRLMNCGVKYVFLSLLLVLIMWVSVLLDSYLCVMVLNVVVKCGMLLVLSVRLVVIVWLLNVMIRFGLCFDMRLSVLCRWKLVIDCFDFLICWFLLLVCVNVNDGWWNFFLSWLVMMLIMFWCYVGLNSVIVYVLVGLMLVRLVSVCCCMLVLILWCLWFIMLSCCVRFYVWLMLLVIRYLMLSDMLDS